MKKNLKVFLSATIVSFLFFIVSLVIQNNYAIGITRQAKIGVACANALISFCGTVGSGYFIFDKNRQKSLIFLTLLLMPTMFFLMLSLSTFGNDNLNKNLFMIFSICIMTTMIYMVCILLIAVTKAFKKP